MSMLTSYNQFVNLTNWANKKNFFHSTCFCLQDRMPNVNEYTIAVGLKIYPVSYF